MDENGVFMSSGGVITREGQGGTKRTNDRRKLRLFIWKVIVCFLASFLAAHGWSMITLSIH